MERMMARPPMGAAARNRVVSVKVTQAEAVELTEVFGSPGKGLRALLDKRYADSASRRAQRDGANAAIGLEQGLADPDAIAVGIEMNERLAALAERDVLTEQGRALASRRDDLIAEGADPADLLVPAAPTEHVDVATMEQPLPRHLHRRHTKIATEFRNGSKVEVWACECGQEMR